MRVFIKARLPWQPRTHVRVTGRQQLIPPGHVFLRHPPNNMKLLSRSIAAIAAVCVMSAAAFAADPSGTWKWTQPSRGGGGGGGTPREITLNLTVKDGKLAGTVAMPSRGGGAPTEVAIKNASVKDDAIAFEVEREYNGNKFVTKYSGKLAGDTITGKSESERNGEVRSNEWVAKREAAKK
jgi:hypothetical protein